MSEHLRATLEHLARPGAESNAAFDRLLQDYACFHLVLALLALALLGAAVVGAVSAWRHGRAAPKVPGRRLTFERVTFSLAFVACIGSALVLALLAAANLSTVIDPLPGFRGSIPTIVDQPAGSAGARTDEAFDRWLQSGERAMPAEVRDAVERRLDWQRPKAVITAVLLVLVFFGGRWLWRSLLARSRRPEHRWTGSELVRLAAALGSLLVGFVLVLMVLGNTQSSLAPISMTLFFG